MEQLEGFIPFDFSEGVPYVSITRNGITFNKSVMMKLQFPNFVQLLIHRENKQLALLECGESDAKAVPFFVAEKMKGSILSVRWNGKDLLNTISGLMGWDLALQAFRVEGQLLAEEHAMLFDLKRAIEIK